MFNPIVAIITLAIILVSMTIHEAMHAFVSYILGDDTAKHQGRLTFNPIKHIDPFMTVILPMTMLLLGGPVFGGAKPVPFNARHIKYGHFGVAMVALAGPLTNLILAFVVFGVGVLTGVIGGDGGISASIWAVIILSAIKVNLGFFVFNMMPIPPLDGSRLLYAVAPDMIREFMEKIEQYGLFVVFTIVLVMSNQIGQIMVFCINAIIDVFIKIFGV